MSNEEEFRRSLIDELHRELIGPVSGDKEELLVESPRTRYSAGILFPGKEVINELDDVSPEEPNNEDFQEEDDSVEIKGPKVKSVGGREELAGEYDDTITMANSYLPSAMGLSFIVDEYVKGLQIKVSASSYETLKVEDGKFKSSNWRRREIDLTPVVFTLDSMESGNVIVDEKEVFKGLKIRLVVRKRRDSAFLITASVFNTHVADRSSPLQSSSCFYQVGMEVRDADGANVIRPFQECSPYTEDPEELSLDLLFRNRRSYGLGHGCTARWEEKDGERSSYIATDSMPWLKIPPVLPRQEGGDELSMMALSGGPDGNNKERVPVILEKLCADYSEWIKETDTAKSNLSERYQKPAVLNIEQCKNAEDRMRSGLSLLASNEVALQAFCLANKAMLMQQVHFRRKTRSVSDDWVDIPENYEPSESWMGQWRTFQIAFILMNLVSLTPDENGEFDNERDIVDLIWFPTGGGKTEAYLGLAAYTIFLRRLLKPDNSGCIVLMRYTLRLLTAQQFQRASALICSCEKIRKDSEDVLGYERISIGLWVGQSLTPNSRNDAIYTLNQMVSKPGQAENKFQLLKCPWCGTKMDEKGNLGYRASGRAPKRVLFVCKEQRCEFSSTRNSLPILVTDEDIYEQPPSLLIGTVDKFAMLAWRKEAGSLFAVGSEKNSPPELIIQDELHLISGPLGSMVGLYESVIDLLCSGKNRRPKIIGSTATIRRAQQQCRNIYNRDTFQFPPSGIDIADSFFAKEKPDESGRIYVGVFPTASSSFVTALVRTAGGLMQGVKSIDLPEGSDESVRDGYWTLVQYFNSLRELGRAATLLQDDIPQYFKAIRQRQGLPKEKYRYINEFDELTSRKTAQEIPEILEKLEISYPKQDKYKPPLDALLATNMISVGVDIERLGIMCILGQPKTTSEYIQASSRVGRSKAAPGLVVSLYNPGKPRDRSHFEQFYTYHSSLYKYVEPTSVTPFSIPVIDRALHAILVIVARHILNLESPDEFQSDSLDLKSALDFITQRCRDVDEEHLNYLEKKFDSLIAHWCVSEPDKWGSFGEPSEEDTPLMYPSGTAPLEEWNDESWPTPSSMRGVDSESEGYVINVYPA